MNPTLLLTHFDRLAESPDAIARLRRFILDLAVRGKLVEQDAGDEPAAELLTKNLHWRTAAIKRKQIRVPRKELLTIGRDDSPYLLPMQWSWVRLGEVIYIQSGDGLTAANMKDGSIPVFGGNGVNGHHDGFNVEEPTLVIGRVGYYCGSIHITPERAWVTDNAFVTHFCPDLFLLRFLALLLTTTNLKENEGATAQPVISGSKIYPIIIGIPPLAEQHRIVAKVDELMALCDQLEAAQQERDRRRDRLSAASLQRLNQPAADATPEEQREHARFHLSHLSRLITRPEQIKAMRQTFYNLAVCGKLVDQKPDDVLIGKLLKQLGVQANKLASDTTLHAIPATWAWVTIEQIANVSSGTTPSRDVSEYYCPDGTPWVTSGETSNAFITETGQHVSDRALKETSLKLYPPGTLIVAMYGQGKTRGQVAELSIAATTNQACAAIVLKLEDVEHRRYVKLFFQKIYEEIRELAAGGAQPNLNGGKIKATFIPLPPLAEQHRIVAKVDELMALCDQLEAQLTITQTDSRRLLEAVLA